LFELVIEGIVANCDHEKPTLLGRLFGQTRCGYSMILSPPWLVMSMPISISPVLIEGSDPSSPVFLLASLSPVFSVKSTRLVWLVKLTCSWSR